MDPGRVLDEHMRTLHAAWVADSAIDLSNQAETAIQRP